ncbi:early light-induced protein 1, chloroplastic-like isoform X2 [Camellia sinensis]|uniref:early light-induced protein 1, chloroplastic-like isoform X2 n=1 Tax=Camellia sinensis TaxID=4442 RepID=UPI0010365ABF|nr:early light-induced protein 1, chloroplastic-like isoform X2 [Camellia sinensis]
MATSAIMQSVLARPVTSVTTRARFGQFTPCSYVPYLQKNASMQVRCMAKVSTKFSDVLAFSGPAPERINGRLAMIGFVAAMAVELSNGEDVLVQISNGGVPWFVGTSIVLTLASLVPLFKGVSVESRSERIMSSDAELWNGRFAMLGLVALAFTEFVKGGALV